MREFARRHMSETSFRINPVRSVADLEATVRLFNAYASSIVVDLGYQDFVAELATIPAGTRRRRVSCSSRVTTMGSRRDASVSGR